MDKQTCRASGAGRPVSEDRTDELISKELISKERKAARTSGRQNRRQIPKPQRDQIAFSLMQRLLPFFHDHAVIGSYIAMEEELDVFSAIKEAGRFILAAPKVLDHQNMEFYPAEELKPGTMGILEPSNGSPIDCGVLLVPLNAFWKMQRLGYAGGYYDRYLASHPQALRIGIALECQKIHFESCSWDQPLDLIITEKAVYARDDAQSRSRMKKHLLGLSEDQRNGWIWINTNQQDKKDIKKPLEAA